MTVAIFGLVGVIVGALVTGGADFLLERRREQREIRRARRLVANELATAAVWVEALLINKRLPQTSSDEVLFSLAEWDSYRQVLAGELNDETWEGLSAAYEILRFDRAKVLEAASLNPGGVYDDEDSRRGWPDLLATIALLRQRLGADDAGRRWTRLARPRTPQ
jgi:hypothetical protein